MENEEEGLLTFDRGRKAADWLRTANRLPVPCPSSYTSSTTPVTIEYSSARSHGRGVLRECENRRAHEYERRSKEHFQKVRWLAAPARQKALAPRIIDQSPSKTLGQSLNFCEFKWAFDPLLPRELFGFLSARRRSDRSKRLTFCGR